METYNTYLILQNYFSASQKAKTLGNRSKTKKKTATKQKI